MAKEIKYREPDGYMPKAIRDKYFGKQATVKKTTTKKTTKKSK